MATPPDFTAGSALTAAQMNKIGLWLITSGTSSGANAYNYDNVFTSDFNNFRVILTDIEVSTAARALRIKFRAGGVTNSNANYFWGQNGWKANGVANNGAGASQTFAEVGVYIDTYANLTLGQSTMDITSPQISTMRTTGLLVAQGYEGEWYWRSGGFVHNELTSNDGFRIELSGTGNIAYKYAIYGYRK